MPEQDYRDMIELLYETGGPDGQPLLERVAQPDESPPETAATAVNQMRRSHAFG